MLDDQPLAGRQFENAVAARSREGILGFLLTPEKMPAVIVEHNRATGDDAVEQGIERADFRSRRIQIDVQKGDRIGCGLGKAVRHHALHDPHVRIGGEPA